MSFNMKEDGDFGLVPEIMLPSQWADMKRAIERPGEARLYFAVLEDAISCYLGRGSIAASFEVGKYYTQMTTRRLKLQWEAECWIFSAAPCDVSFEFCCELFNINVAWLRKELKRVRRERDDEQNGQGGNDERVAPAASQPALVVQGAGQDARATARHYGDEADDLGRWEED